ncbi:hypothetical protein M1555_01570, partial [Patescibacteria group bacterium]|nr:hypothetical protein [Patescibacteria group bacterium]
MPRVIKIVLMSAGFAAVFSGAGALAPVYAACTPPSDYTSCQSSAFGTNGAALMDSQYNPIETDFARLRQMATQSDPATQNQRIQATIILTDGTIADQAKTSEIFQNAEKYGIDMTIRTWGNVMDTPVASQMGANLSAEVSAFKTATGRPIRVELGNEPNLDTTGARYAAEFAAFAQACTSCTLSLPSMGGFDGSNKQQFIESFLANPQAAAAAQRASGIVFNSYANTPQGAVTDWVNTLALWQQAGINTSQMNYFLTETGPPDGSNTWPNLTGFLQGIAREYERIKNDPSDPNYAAFQKLTGLTFFIWDKNQRLQLVFIDQNGKVQTVAANPGANVTGQIQVDTTTPVSNVGSSGKMSYPEESEQPCLPMEGTGPDNGDTATPRFRDYTGKEMPSQRSDAGLINNIGVRGLHCGMTKSTPIMLREEAAFTLKSVPQCKTVKWMGEIQMNYGAPGNDPDLQFRIPFAKELADQWAGDWDAEHVTPAEMSQKEALASSAMQSSTYDPAGAKALTEIQERQGVLKKLLTTGQQDKLKCDFITYVRDQGGNTMYRNFAVDGTPITGIVCPPTVDNPQASQEEYARWQSVWGTTWNKLGLYPNERAFGNIEYVVCDNRSYPIYPAYPDVMRMGLAANTLFQIMTPVAAQDIFYTGNYFDMKDPLKWLSGGNEPPPSQPPPPGFASNPLPAAPPPQLPPGTTPTPGVTPTPAPVGPPNSQSEADHLKNWQRPVSDNGKCVNFMPRGYYSARDFEIQIPRLKELGVTWVDAIYQDENQLKLAAENFSAAGITPIWRRELKVNQAPTGYPWARDVAIMKQYNLPPYIQLYNEPGDPREYSNGQPDFSLFLDHFMTIGQNIINAGGKVGLQLQDPNDVTTVVNAIRAREGANADNFFNNMFFVPHTYAANHPPGWTADEIGVMGFRFYADAFQKALGWVPPFMVGEGGWDFNNQADAAFPKTTDAVQAQYYQELFNWFKSGKLSDGSPLPDYLFAFCPWILDASGTEWESTGWYGPNGVSKPDTVQAIESLGSFTRQFSWSAGQGMVPLHLRISAVEQTPVARGVIGQEVLSAASARIAAGTRTVSAMVQSVIPGIRETVGSVGRQAAWALHDMGIPIPAGDSGPGGRFLAQATGTPQSAAAGSDNYITQYACGSLLCSIGIVNNDPNHFVYQLVIQRTAQSPPGILGDLAILPPDNYAAANPGKTGPHVQSMPGNELRFLSDYPAADGFMPQVHSADELKHYVFQINGKRLPDKYKFDNVAISYQGGNFGAPSLPNLGCNPYEEVCECRETATCGYSCGICGKAQMGPSDTTYTTYNKNHDMLGVNWMKGAGPGGPGSAKPEPIELTWQIPAWKPGERPLPAGCTIQKVKNAPACGDDDACQAAGFDACGSGGTCGAISCVKVHDRVVDVYNNVPFTASAWKEAAASAGPDNIVGGFFNLFKPADAFTGQAGTLGQGCSADPNIVFDRKGNFADNPGGNPISYNFDQGFGVGASRADYNFGQPDVYVTYAKPTGNAKLLFYKLGGLCNANTWVSSQLFKPSSTAAVTALSNFPGTSGTSGTGSTGFSGLGKSGSPGTGTAGTPKPATTPITAPAEANSVIAAVGSVTELPQGEEPEVATVTNSAVVAAVPALSRVQNNDIVLTYPKAKETIVFRPSTNQVVAEVPTTPVALRDGSGNAALFSALAEDIRADIPSAVLTEQSRARKQTYQESLFIDPRQTKVSQGRSLASLLNMAFALIPSDEAMPSADFLVIAGGPKIALRNGTTVTGALTTYAAALQSKLPTVTITDEKDAAGR